MRVLTEKVMAGKTIKNPLVLDIDGQFTDNIHVDSIAHDGIRKELSPNDRIPGGREDWTTDADTIAQRAFKHGHDALVLTNTAEGKNHTVRPTGLEGLAEHRLMNFGTFLEEFFLSEDDHPDPFEATYAKHRDAIHARAHENTGDWYVHSYHDKKEHTGGGLPIIHARGIIRRDVGDEVRAQATGRLSKDGLHYNHSDLAGAYIVPHRDHDDQFEGYRKYPKETLVFKPIYNDNDDFVKHIRGDHGPLDGPHPWGNSMPGAIGEHSKTNEDVAKFRLKNAVEGAAPRAKYIPKILKMYANGSINRFEDIRTQAADAFKKYDKLVTQGHIRTDLGVGGTPFDGDPNRFIGHHQLKKMTSLRQIQDVVNHPAYAEALKEPAPKAKEGEYSIVHDDEHVTVYQPHTHAASVALAHCPHTGKKASWCISSDSEGGKQLFDEDGTHNTPYPGAKFFFHPKNPKHPGELHAVVPLANEYRDEHDDEAHYSDSLRRSYNTGIQHEAEDGEIRGRYPGFGHGEITQALYKHAYEKPHLYANNSGGRALKDDEHADAFMAYVHSRNPTYDKDMWRSKTPEEHENARLMGNSAAALFNTVPKDPEAYERAREHHKKVMHLFWGQHESSHYHDPDYDDEHDH